MKAMIASIFAVSAALTGFSAQAADLNTEATIAGNTTESVIVMAALSKPMDIVSDEEKKSDEEKADDKKSDEEKKTDDEKKSD